MQFRKMHDASNPIAQSRSTQRINSFGFVDKDDP